MKLTEKQQKLFWWLRSVMLLLMAIGGIVAGVQPGFLPASAPQVGGFLSAIAGAVATWAGSVMPGDTQPEPEKGNETPK